MAQSCAAAGGTKLAILQLASFFATNILAHAATIYLLPGSNITATFFAVQAALIHPVSAGDRAFQALLGWAYRNMWCSCAPISIGGNSFEDAVNAGAIAIFVPRCFAPLVSGRWQIVHDYQHTLFLNHARYSYPRPGRKFGYTFRRMEPTAVRDYYSFVLPPNCDFPGYHGHKIYPASSVLRQIIAIGQIVYASYELYVKKSGSLSESGLASPFLIVIPYILMSFINLICNLFVNTYTHVTVLPMAKDLLPQPNIKVILEGPNRYSTMRLMKHWPLSFLRSSLIGWKSRDVNMLSVMALHTASLTGFDSMAFVRNRSRAGWNNFSYWFADLRAVQTPDELGETVPSGHSNDAAATINLDGGEGHILDSAQERTEPDEPTLGDVHLLAGNGSEGVMSLGMRSNQ